MGKAQHSKLTPEHYTPPEYAEAVRRVLLRVDLDPFSCAAANDIIKANGFYSRAHNGFRHQWHGTVFANPPGGMLNRVLGKACKACVDLLDDAACDACGGSGWEVQPDTEDEANEKEWTRKRFGTSSSAGAAWVKLCEEMNAGRIDAAIFLAFNIELLSTSQGTNSVSMLSLPICVPAQRIRYVGADGLPGDQPPHASAFVLCSRSAEQRARFAEVFSQFGAVRL